MFFDHYKLPGPWYWVKYALYYSFFTVIKKILRLFNVHTKHGKPADNDGPHALNNNTIGYDATWIGGVTSGDKWIVLALDRRNDCKTSIGYAYLKIPEIGEMVTPMYPDSVENVLGKSESDFALDNYRFETIEPLRRWNISFKGKMNHVDDPSVSVHVQITARWTSDSDVWLLNRDLSSRSFAEAFALENWTKFTESLFDRAKDNVVHWEQFGRLSAVVQVDDGKSMEIRDAMTVRDRSFGKSRDFTTMHRYFYVTMFLENGRSLVIAVVCHKVTFSRFFFGFIDNADGTNTNIDWSDLNIHQFGENGRVPEELCFLIKIGHAVRAVQLVCNGDRHWYRLERDVLRYEQTGRCSVDDQPGRCMVQSLYNETSLRAKTFGELPTFPGGRSDGRCYRGVHR